MRTYDLAVVGATGFTGRLVVKHLCTFAPEHVRIALVGRNLARLESVPRREGMEYVVLDILQKEHADKLAAASRVVLTTAGPYSRYGSALVASCAEQGTHYADLAGEVPWIHQMINKWSGQAQATGACIVHCCGFDSMPSDLGVLVLREEMIRQGLSPARIRYALGASSGGFSGGTIHSLLGVLEDARQNQETAKLVADPNALISPDRVPQSAAVHGTHSVVATPRFDAVIGSWTIPFFMGVINERVVRRTNSLSGFPLGPDPDYREVIPFGAGVRGRGGATAAAAIAAIFATLLNFRPTRWILRRFFLPKPGQGPKVALQGGGNFAVRLTGISTGGESVSVTVGANRDPGYGATAIMISEIALLLAQAEETPVPAGFHTPATAGGLRLVNRLIERGFFFSVEEPTEHPSLPGAQRDV